MLIHNNNNNLWGHETIRIFVQTRACLCVYIQVHKTIYLIDFSTKSTKVCTCDKLNDYLTIKKFWK